MRKPFKCRGAETQASSGRGSSCPRRRVALVIFGVVFTLYLLNFRTLDEVDCVPAPYVAWSIVHDGSFALGAYRDLDRLRGSVVVPTPAGQWVSKYPMGSSVATVPVVIPFALVLERPPGPKAMRWIGKLAAALYAAGSVALVWSTAKRVAPRGALPAALVLAFGTPMLGVASQSIWAHAPAAFGITLALVGTLNFGWPEKPTTRTAVIVAVAASFALLNRPPLVPLAGAAALVMLWHKLYRHAIIVLGGVAAVLALMAWYNTIYFGSWSLTGYGSEAGQWRTPIVQGLLGLTVSPSRGLFVFTPALILGALYLGRLACGGPTSQPAQRGPLLIWTGGAVAVLLLYSKWHVWAGGWSFGPRFLIETLPVWSLLLALQWESASQRQVWRWVSWSLVMLSILVNLPSFVSHRGYVAWHERLDRGETSYWRISDNLIWSTARGAFMKRGTIASR